MSATVHDRVRELIDRQYVGKVQRAAKAWGVPQPTLRRIYQGLNVRPSAEALHRIARATGTTTEWLLTGEGSPPVSGDERSAPVASAKEWRALLGEIATAGAGEDPFPDAERRRVLTNKNEAFAVYRGLAGLVDLPWAVSYLLGVWESTPVKDARALEDAALEAVDVISRAWITFLRRAIALLGADVVWQRLRSSPLDVALRFSDAAAILESGGRDLWRELLNESAEFMIAQGAKISPDIGGDKVVGAFADPRLSEDEVFGARGEVVRRARKKSKGGRSKHGKKS